MRAGGGGISVPVLTYPIYHFYSTHEHSLRFHDDHFWLWYAYIGQINKSKSACNSPYGVICGSSNTMYLTYHLNERANVCDAQRMGPSKRSCRVWSMMRLWIPTKSELEFSSGLCRVNRSPQYVRDFESDLELLFSSAYLAMYIL